MSSPPGGVTVPLHHRSRLPKRKQLELYACDSVHKRCKMVEFADPKGPVKEGIDNAIFIFPAIIVVIVVGKYFQKFLRNIPHLFTPTGLLESRLSWLESG